MILRLFDLSRVARLAEDDSGRANEGRYRRGKHPRSITLLQERRKSIDLGTEAAARRLRRNRRWIRSLRHRARVSPRHASHLGGIDIFKSSRTCRASVSYLTTYYISIITFRDTSVFETERCIILLRRLRVRDVRNCTHTAFYICSARNYYVLGLNRVPKVYVS